MSLTLASWFLRFYTCHGADNTTFKVFSFFPLIYQYHHLCSIIANDSPELLVAVLCWCRCALADEIKLSLFTTPTHRVFQMKLAWMVVKVALKGSQKLISKYQQYYYFYFHCNIFGFSVVFFGSALAYCFTYSSIYCSYDLAGLGSWLFYLWLLENVNCNWLIKRLL